MDIRKFEKVGKVYLSDTSFLKYAEKSEGVYFWCQHYPRQNISRRLLDLVMWADSQSNYCNHCKLAKECFDKALRIRNKLKEKKIG